MPGCGKTTVGQIIATKTGRLFIDCDIVLAETAGMSIPEIFEQEKEEGFRLRETQVLKDVCKNTTDTNNSAMDTAFVIATGGGCVTRQENYQILKSFGIVIFIERDTSLLEKQGRPLSIASNMEEMYKTRLPLYKQFADIVFKNDVSAELTAENIIKAI